MLRYTISLIEIIPLLVRLCILHNHLSCGCAWLCVSSLRRRVYIRYAPSPAYNSYCCCEPISFWFLKMGFYFKTKVWRGRREEGRKEGKEVVARELWLPSYWRPMSTLQGQVVLRRCRWQPGVRVSKSIPRHIHKPECSRTQSETWSTLIIIVSSWDELETVCERVRARVCVCACV